MTPEAATIAALNTHAGALGEDFPSLVYREIGDQLPAEYVMVDHLPNISTRPMLDSTRQDLSGIYQLTLARAKGQHEIVYREQAAQILAHFMDAIRLTADGKTLTITQATAGQGRADGTRWLIPISIYYRLDA